MQKNRTINERSKYDGLISFLLICLFGFMPLAYGSSQSWAKEIVITLSGIIAIVFCFRVLSENRFNFSISYLPIILFIGIGFLQLVTLPTSIAGLLSGNTVSLKSELLSDGPLKNVTLSFYPNATRHDLRLLLGAAMIFIVSINTFNSIEKIRNLLKWIVCIGAVVAVIALFQDAFGNGKIYGVREVAVGNATSGPFVNHSHFGQFINLSIGAALGLLLLRINEFSREKNLTATKAFEYLASSRAKDIWFYFAMIILGMCALFISLTRGGIISMLAAFLVTGFVVTKGKMLKGSGWIFIAVGLFAFSAVIYTSFDIVYDRLASINSLEPCKYRIQTIKDLGQCIQSFPVFGTGMGTHAVVYPMYDNLNLGLLSTHVENEYVQALEETGIAGLICLIGFGVVVLLSYRKNIRSGDFRIVSITNGLSFGLIAILIHSLTDFGQHLPPNAFLSVLFCAMIVAMSQNQPQTAKVQSSKMKRYFGFAGLIVTIGIFGWSLNGAHNAKVANSYWNKAQSLEKELIAAGWNISDDQYEELLGYVSNATANEPDNVIYRYWNNVFRYRYICRNQDDAWPIVPEANAEEFEEIVNDLSDTRYICPTYGPVYSVLGQLEYILFEDEDISAENINKGYKLAKNDPAACYVAGLFDINFDRVDESFEKINKAIKLNGILFDEAATIYVEKVDRPDLAIAAAGKNIYWLRKLKRKLEAMDSESKYIETVENKIITLLKKECSSEKTAPRNFAWLAEMYLDSDKETARQMYEKALAAEYANTGWRIDLAKLLGEMGQRDEAMHQARLCLKIEPGMYKATELIKELSVKNVSLDDI